MVYIGQCIGQSGNVWVSVLLPNWCYTFVSFFPDVVIELVISAMLSTYISERKVLNKPARRFTTSLLYYGFV